MPLPVAGANINVGAWSASHLNHDVPGRAKPVNPQSCSFTFFRLDFRQPQRPISDNPRAQQRRGLQIIEGWRQRINKIGGRGQILGKTPIGGPAVELSALAKIFTARATEPASAISLSQPGDTHAIA